MKTLAQIRSRQKGQSMAEYAILVSLIALVCIGAVALFGKQIKKVFTNATEQMENNGDESADDE